MKAEQEKGLEEERSALTGTIAREMWTNLDQNGWRMCFATTEWSTPLYLYQRSVTTPCWLM
jgi:hypothetical protein